MIIGWVLFFRLIPISYHTIEIGSIDDVGMELLTEERGGVIRTGRHYITVEPLGDDRCRCEDRIEIDAGILTAVVASFTRVFRYRQRRWAQLSGLLAASADPALPP